MLRRLLLAGSSSLLLAACSSGGGGGSTTPAPTPTPTPTPTPICSLRDRQDWAAAQLRSWYLYPDTLPATLDPGPYSSVEAYVDALTATARAQGRDRNFTYLTSIEEEQAFYQTGRTAAFGIRIRTEGSEVHILDAFEGGPALAAGVDRGQRIEAIGQGPDSLVSVASLVAAGGTALDDAFGPSEAGVTRSFRVNGPGGPRVVTLVKAQFDIPPVSPRFGVQVIEEGGRRYGYLNLRSFIEPAEPALRTAFQRFQREGVTDLVIDFRYNGGGLLDTAFLMGDLLGGGRSSFDVQSFVTYRPERAANDETRRFIRRAESIAPTRLAFLSTSATASASEAVINGMLPWLPGGTALVGANSFGKPVGQVALDRPACDDRLRVVAFAVQNADRQGDYFTGLAGRVPNSCAADDTVAVPLGDTRDDMMQTAIGFLAGRGCPVPIATARAQRLESPPRLPVPSQPSVAQRELPGLM